MKRFVAVFIGTSKKMEQSGWNALPEAERKQRELAGIQAWSEWGSKHAAAIVDHGAPLGKTKKASPAGIGDTKNNITGYTIVQAESHDAAVRLFEHHPHFTIFPGDSVEVMECLPIPGQ